MILTVVVISDICQPEESWNVVLNHTANGHTHSLIFIGHSLQDGHGTAADVGIFVESQILCCVRLFFLKQNEY